MAKIDEEVMKKVEAGIHDILFTYMKDMDEAFDGKLKVSLPITFQIGKKGFFEAKIGIGFHTGNVSETFNIPLEQANLFEGNGA